jgi:hypothetical protein
MGRWLVGFICGLGGVREGRLMLLPQRRRRLARQGRPLVSEGKEGRVRRRQGEDFE